MSPTSSDDGQGDPGIYFVMRNSRAASQGGFLEQVTFQLSQLSGQTNFAGALSTVHDLYVGGHPVADKPHTPDKTTAVGVNRVFVGPYVSDDWLRDRLLYNGLHYMPATADEQFVVETEGSTLVIPDMLFDFGKATCLFPGAPPSVRNLLLGGVDAAMAVPGHFASQNEHAEDDPVQQSWTFRPWLYLFEASAWWVTYRTPSTGTTHRRRALLSKMAMTTRRRTSSIWQWTGPPSTRTTRTHAAHGRLQRGERQRLRVVDTGPCGLGAFGEVRGDQPAGGGQRARSLRGRVCHFRSLQEITIEKVQAHKGILFGVVNDGGVYWRHKSGTTAGITTHTCSRR